MSFQTITFAALGGLLPALLWLWFWRREDRRHPEPRPLIALAFLAGIIAVPLVLPLEKYVAKFVLGGSEIETIAGINLMLALTGIILWSLIEEILKFLAAYLTVLRRKEVDEPIDLVIYMITVALGFAAAENALFLLDDLE